MRAPVRQLRGRARAAAAAAAPREATRADRDRRIREIIVQQSIGTQEELAGALRRQGLAVTQATVSRDIKRLGLVKVTMGDGQSRYVIPDRPSPVDVLRRLRHAITEYVLSVDAGEDLVVIHTLSGRANAVAAAVDDMRWEDIVGTVAGDDTILVVPRGRPARERVLGRFRRLIEGRAPSR
jgi:transcriptional regulator of arginine metabolism